MNIEPVTSFFDWLLAHASEVALAGTGVVVVLVLLIVFGPKARAWRNPPAPDVDHSEDTSASSGARR